MRQAESNKVWQTNSIAAKTELRTVKDSFKSNFSFAGAPKNDANFGSGTEY
jgi:hypothetical protein